MMCVLIKMKNKGDTSMNAQLTPSTIQQLYGKYLDLADAQCLFDLFTNQTTRSQWIDSKTVASWMFQTNSPSEFQLKRAKSLLHKLSTVASGPSRKAALLDMQIQSLDSGYGSMIIKPAYKLSSAISDSILV